MSDHGATWNRNAPSELLLPETGRGGFPRNGRAWWFHVSDVALGTDSSKLQICSPVAVLVVILVVLLLARGTVSWRTRLRGGQRRGIMLQSGLHSGLERNQEGLRV